MYLSLDAPLESLALGMQFEKGQSPFHMVNISLPARRSMQLRLVFFFFFWFGLEVPTYTICMLNSSLETTFI